MQSGSGAQSSESLEQMFANAPRPALLAMAGLLMLGLCVAMAAKGIEGTLIVPLLLGVVGVGVSWLRFTSVIIHGTIASNTPTSSAKPATSMVNVACRADCIMRTWVAM